MLKIYIAGPMTGKEFCNVVAFFQAAKWVREHPLSFGEGYGELKIINPAQEALEKGLDLSSEGKGIPFVKIIAGDLTRLSNCNILVLMEGWKTSIGSAIEFLSASQDDKIKIFEFHYNIRGDIKGVKRFQTKNVGIKINLLSS